ncbi:MAG: ferredoxin [Acidobacteria bacterium]|nr:ferredoxin [Acidobacteriota bacterium]
MSAEATIAVNLARCVGSTMCIQVAPSVFALTDVGQSCVTDAGGDTMERIVEAAEELSDGGDTRRGPPHRDRPLPLTEES